MVTPELTAEVASEHISRLKDLRYFKIRPLKTIISGVRCYVCKSDRLDSYGKGVTDAQARASALMEFCERYSHINFNYKRAPGYVVKSFSEMSRAKADVVPRSYFLSNFFDLANVRNLLAEIAGIRLKWIKGRSLISGRDIYYPINWHNYIFTSTGLASGNTFEEAILAGLCEVIERENIYRFFVDRRKAPDVDLGSFSDPLIRSMIEQAGKAGIRLRVKDISFDLKVPTFILQGRCEKRRGLLTGKGSGQGCHPDPDKALMRCLTEYFESFAALEEIERTPVWFGWDELISCLPRKNFGFINRFNQGMFDRASSSVARSKFKSISRKGGFKELRCLLNVMKRKKFDVIIVNKIHPKINIPVARVIVPGMRSNISNETNDIRRILSLVYHEADEHKAAIDSLKKSLLAKKYAEYFSGMGDKIDFYDVDYLKTLEALGDKKTNVLFLNNGLTLGR